MGTQVFPSLATKGGGILGGCSHSVLRVQRGAEEAQASLFQKPMHSITSGALPCTLPILENVFLQGSDQHIASQSQMVLKTNSLWIQSHRWLLSIPFQSALYYPSAAHWVRGLPGSFALPLSSSAGSILPFQVWLRLPNLQIANEKIKWAQFATCSQSQRILLCLIPCLSGGFCCSCSNFEGWSGQGEKDVDMLKIVLLFFWYFKLFIVIRYKEMGISGAILPGLFCSLLWL